MTLEIKNLNAFNEMNIQIIDNFFSSQHNHLIVNKINSQILAFYVYLFTTYAIKYRSQILFKNHHEIQLASPDLFDTNQYIYLIETNHNRDIKKLIQLNKKIIIITDYKNYKVFSKSTLSINSYSYESDIKSFLNKMYGIEDDILIKNIIAYPEYCYSEIEKFITNKKDYPMFHTVDDSNVDKISIIRKKIYQLKEINDLLNLYNLLKIEVLSKKFNLLAF